MTTQNIPEPVRGRGSAFNPSNRFDRIGIEWNEYAHEPQTTSIATEYYKDTSKTIISYNDSPDVGFDASLNPYRGCEHGCIYCYARPTHEYLGLSAGLDFESKIFAKLEAAKLLEKELAHPKWTPQVLVMSGVTDCYQPAERKLEITRACLKVCLDFRNPVSIITKNALVTRDIDVLKELHEFRCASVNISVTSLDPHVARVMEPRASAPAERLRAIEELAKSGIPVNVMVAPIVPALTDHEIPQILKAVKAAGASSAAFVVLRLPFAVKDLFESWLTMHFPERKDKILNRIRDLRGGKLYDAKFGQRMRGEGVFAEQIEAMFEVAYKKTGFNESRFRLSTASFRNPRNQQFELFG